MKVGLIMSIAMDEDKVNIEGLENSDILDRWYGYIVGLGQGSSKTLETYKTQISKLAVWCEGQKADKNILQLTRRDIREYLEYIMGRQDYARNTISLNVKAVRSFYTWAVDIEEVIDKTPIPAGGIKLKGRVSVRWTPTYKQIMEIRNAAPNRVPRKPGFAGKNHYDMLNALAIAAFIELVTTTGMRLGEIEQLRVDNLDFKAQVYDDEHKCRSAYVGGSIYIDAYTISSKRYKEKTVWFGPLAARLLKLYIQQAKLDGPMPLFPWNRRILQRWVAKAGKGIIGSPHVQTGVRRDKYFSDISPEILARMSKPQRDRILAKQKKGENLSAHERKADHLPLQKNRQMKVHAYRNFNACLLYHRGWNGTRHNIAYVRDCLGHSSDTQSLEYIAKAMAIKNDREWELLVVGNAKSYWHIFHHYKNK